MPDNQRSNFYAIVYWNISNDDNNGIQLKPDSGGKPRNEKIER